MYNIHIFATHVIQFFLAFTMEIELYLHAFTNPVLQKTLGFMTFSGGIEM